MEKRLILAVALSILIIVTFQHFFVKPPVSTPPSAPGGKVALRPSDEIVPKGPLPKRSIDEIEFSIETDRFVITFSDIGGAIKRVILKDYKKAGTNEPFTLLQVSDPKNYIFAFSTILNSTLRDLLPYKGSKEDSAIIYSRKADDVEISKRYILHNTKHIIELQLLIKNLSYEPKEISYRMVGGAGIIEPSTRDIRLVEIISKVNDSIVKFKRVKENECIINPGIVNWTALKSKYFSVILKPLDQTKAQYYSETKEDGFINGIESSGVTIPPNSSVEHRFILYLGPNQSSYLKEGGHDFSETMTYGFFGGISKILISILRFFYAIVKNWGISIILLSIFLNIILFPLSVKSFQSIKKMQELQPEMEKLKAQYKSNPQKLNKETMELYKKYKINPLGGCLPMLLQLPIFFALYQALIRFIDLKDAKFLWIKDLSSPDAISIPFRLPLIGNSINILPILMIIAMVIQQKISTKSMGTGVTREQKEQQKLMMILMPVMFGFIFYTMPSGLVLYWLVNTILTVVEQGAIFKK